MRTMASMPVPAASGTTMVTLRVGYSCAWARKPGSTIAMAQASANLKNQDGVVMLEPPPAVARRASAAAAHDRAILFVTFTGPR
jgi:hypothetical protein